MAGAGKMAATVGGGKVAMLPLTHHLDNLIHFYIQHNNSCPTWPGYFA